MQKYINIPNAITSLRIVFSVGLCLLKPLSEPFLICYLICCISDVLDGYLARRLGQSSSFGAKFDSVADMFFVLAILVVILPLLNLSSYLWAWIGAIAWVRICSIIVAWRKHHTFVPGLHTYLNKFTGLVFFSIPVALYFIYREHIIEFVCILASLSAVEELLITILSKTLNLNIKGLGSLILK
jgi:CDP-diacylglycerol---glycerol-3-phosphate 3-phosphatidyltransferase